MLIKNLGPLNLHSFFHENGGTTSMASLDCWGERMDCMYEVRESWYQKKEVRESFRDREGKIYYSLCM